MGDDDSGEAGQDRAQRLVTAASVWTSRAEKVSSSTST